MSTATNRPTAVHLARHTKKIFRRFAWKEFRMLRSLWLAVAIMGLLVQCAEKMLLPGSTDFALALLYTALSAAVMYAVGAAATAFSVEHEEETYDLLTRLPTTWWPLFAGKLLVILASSLLLAIVLSLAALAFRGPHFTTEDDARSALGMMGFAIIEAIAWGTLFSLFIKRPLVAAIATLVVGTLATSAAVNIAASYSYPLATLNPEAYAHAIPVRLAIVMAVFVLSLNFASGWLTPSTEQALAAHLKRDSRLMTWLAGGRSRTREVNAVVQRASRRRTLARLLWQTWRESWKLLLAPIGVAVLLTSGIGAAIGLSHAYGEVTSFVMADALLFAPALYGAMAFYADQRRGSYRFLAEHAARPRYTWVARHIVWLGAFIVVWFLMLSVIGAFLVTDMQRTGNYRLEWYLDWGNPPTSPSEFYELGYGLQILIPAIFAASFAAMVAYGVGQFLSMTFRSEILAAFLALLISLVLGAFVWVIWLWQLSPALFLLPIFAGLMLATWLRAPDWIAERNSWRAWMKPTMAILATLMLIGAMLPHARLAQMKQKTRADRDYIPQQILPEQEFAA
jgi:ABC-type transport system involved in multi-copper enzyme maturation permease subunit